MAKKRKRPSMKSTKGPSKLTTRGLRSLSKSSPELSPPSLSPKVPVTPSSAKRRVPRPRVALHAKGFQKTRDKACQQYRIPWSGRMMNRVNKSPQGIPNTRAICYRNTSYQLLMSIPAFVHWLERYHAFGCPIDHCVGCHLHKIYKLIYPNLVDENDLDQGPQIKTTVEVEALLADHDHYYEDRNMFVGCGQNWPFSGAQLEARGVADKGDTGEYVHFLIDAVMKRNPPGSEEEIDSIFTKYFDYNLYEKCRVDSAHDNHRVHVHKATTNILRVHSEKRDRNTVAAGLKRWASEDGQKHEEVPCLTCHAIADRTAIPILHKRRTPEVFIFAVDREVDEDSVRDRDDIEFPECFDLMPILSAERRANGETALYRLSAFALSKDGWKKGKGHVTAVVRDPAGGWSFLNDSRTSRSRWLSKILDNPKLANYEPSVLVYVKAEGDTTQGEKLDMEEYSEVREAEKRCDPDKKMSEQELEESWSNSEDGSKPIHSDESSMEVPGLKALGLS